jgi:TRAP transporter 4TM/12TM fusion protein
MSDQAEAPEAGAFGPTGFIPAFADFLAAGIVVVSAGWALNAPRYLGVAFYPAQLFSLLLGAAVCVAFLTRSFWGGARFRKTPWWDVVAGLAALVAGAVMAVRYPSLVDLVLMRPTEAVILGSIMLPLSLEALRRVSGPALVCIILVFLLYALFGDVVPGRLTGRAQDWPKIASYLTFDVNGILGVPMQIASTVVIAFVLFGMLLSRTGGAKFFTDAALIAMGGLRGGAMKIAVLGSALFGSISGSAVANVMATGIVTIPMIKRAGYSAHRAAAIEAVASTGGQLLPPVMGAAAFLMAEFLYVPYSTVALAALVPGLLYYAALFIQADLEALRHGIKAVPKADRPRARDVVGGWHFGAAFAILILALFTLNRQPAEAALMASAVAVITASILGYQGKRASARDLLGSITQAGHASLDLLLICAGAGMVIGVLNMTGLSFNLTFALVQLGGGSKLLLLVMAAVVCIILGMGLPTLGVYVLLATLVAPALVEVGVNRTAAHLYVLYFGMMSMITPPVAIAAFAAAGIAGASPMRTGFEAMRFGWPAYVVPVLFALSPSLILVGSLWETATAVVTALFGVTLMSIAMTGFLKNELSPVERIGLAVCGLGAMTPAGAFEGALYTDLVGICAGSALLFWLSRRSPSVAPG